MRLHAQFFTIFTLIVQTGCSRFILPDKPANNINARIDVDPGFAWEGFMVIDFRIAPKILALRTKGGLIKQTSVDSGEVLHLYRTRKNMTIFLPPEQMSSEVDFIILYADIKQAFAQKFVSEHRFETAQIIKVVPDNDWNIELGSKGVNGSIYRIGPFTRKKLVDDKSPRIEIE